MSDMDIPLPPPIEVVEISSPSKYSPSHATSDDDLPPLPSSIALPPTRSSKDLPPLPSSASIPPKKVLGNSEAKKRLQAFKHQRMMKVVKTKGNVFGDDDDDDDAKNDQASKPARKFEQKDRGFGSAIASIMKEEIQEKESMQVAKMHMIKLKIEQKSNSIAAKTTETVNAGEEDRNKPFDLKDLLEERRKNRANANNTNENSNTKAATNHQEDLRDVLNRLKNKSPEDKTPNSRRSRDNSPVHSKSRGRSNEGDKLRQRELGSEASSERRRRRNPSNEENDYRRRNSSGASRNRRGSGRGDPEDRASSYDRDRREISPENRSLSKSAEKTGRRQSPANAGSKGEGIEADTRPGSRDDEEASEEIERKRRDLSCDKKSNSAKKKGLKRDRSVEKTPTKTEKARSCEETVTPSKKKKKKRKIEVEEESKDEEDVDGEDVSSSPLTTITLDTTQNDSFDSQESVFDVLPASDQDYFIVKNEKRNIQDLSWCSKHKDGFILRFPTYRNKETTSCKTSINWSWNPSFGRDPEKERMLRASVDSALSELENEMKAKKPQESKVVKPSKKKKKIKKKGKNQDKLDEVERQLSQFKGKKQEQKVKAILDLIKKKKKPKKLKKKVKKTKVKLDDSIDVAVDDEQVEEVRTVKHVEEIRTVKQVESQPETEDEAPAVDESNAEKEEFMISPAPSEKASEEVVSVGPPLSSAGMSKLFALAGYRGGHKSTEPNVRPDDKVNIEPEDRKEVPLKPVHEEDRKVKVDEQLENGLGSRLTKLGSRHPSLTDHLSPGRGAEEKMSTPGSAEKAVAGTPGVTPDYLQSPLHQDRSTPVKDELIRMMDRRPKSPSPTKLPKMRDSRSPTKVPIMRDQRSPLPARNDLNGSSHNDDHPRERDHFGSNHHRSPRFSDRRSYHDEPKDWESNRRRTPPRDPDHIHVSDNSRYSPTTALFDEEPSPRKVSHTRSSRSPRGGYPVSPKGGIRPALHSSRSPRRASPPRDYNDRPRSPAYGQGGRSPPRQTTSPGRRWSPPRGTGGGGGVWASPGRGGLPQGFRQRSSSFEDSRALLEGRRLLTPIRQSSLDRRTGRPYSPGQHYARSPRRQGRSPRRFSRSPRRRSRSPRRRSRSLLRRPSRSPRRHSRSPRRRSRSPIRRSRSPRRLNRSLPRRHSRSPRRFSRSPPRRNSRSPHRRSPRRGSPHLSPRRFSPRRGDSLERSRLSPRRLSPRRVSPRRYPLQRSPSPRGGHRPPTPPRGRLSPVRLRRSPTPDRHRAPHPLSPRRSQYSPQRVDSSRRRSLSPVRDVRPDSTIQDSDLGQARLPYDSVKNSDFSNSPQRVSLDERLEQELGLKREREEAANNGGLTKLATGLPTTIPTYDSLGLPATKVSVEKEQAMVAAQLVTSKLMEMQAIKEAERQKKREQRMADRLAASMPVKPGGGAATVVDLSQDISGVQKVAAAGRILEQVEAQELQASSKDQKSKKQKEEEGKPTLITLKPFYRPTEKKPKKKKPESPLEEDWPEYRDSPRSPVPLPDNSVCTPVLVKLGFGVSKEKSGKRVKYGDGVVPGQGSPDQNTPQESPKIGKRYKKVRLLVLCDKDVEDPLPPPPPPPGSPPRYNISELVAKYGQNNVMEIPA